MVNSEIMWFTEKSLIKCPQDLGSPQQQLGIKQLPI